MQRVVIGLGSNLGSRARLLREAVYMVASHEACRLEAVSRVYETEPVGPPQPGYLNAAVRIATTLDLGDLLGALLAIEKQLGRERSERWGPRTCDLDILWAFGTAVATETLTVPHPRLRERPFALAPLLDVAPEASAEYAATLAHLGGPPERSSSLEELVRRESGS